MTTDTAAKIAAKLSFSKRQVQAVLNLTDEGATLPFIARYRKEKTGSLDEVQLGAILKEYDAFKALQKRRDAILASLTERDLLNDQLKAAIDQADTLTELEDIYLPYKAKRRTKATEAKEKGLEPLAKSIFFNKLMASSEINRFVNPGKGVASAEDALEGAQFIIAEWVAENATVRERLRVLLQKKGILTSSLVKKKEDEAVKFKDYFKFTEPVQRVPSHRVLAILRGKSNGFLTVKITLDPDQALRTISQVVLRQSGICRQYVESAIKDCLKRLLHPSLENECLNQLKEKADIDAIAIFSNNLQQLLMYPPLGPKRVLAIDPGFRTGCKAVALDNLGNFKAYKTIFPFESNKANQAEADVIKLIKQYDCEMIAVGNGTAGRETQDFLKALDQITIPIVTVDESGASIYSASEVARNEFPDLDLTLRGAISIGRRLQDPLAELVKIDPKSIGVGQYQHDVDQGELKKALDRVVESCVNSVGVDLNSASVQLLSYVAGLGPQLAANIVAYRAENGPFKTRVELKKVPRLGPKAFEQAAGFLRIPNAANPLDSSAVHPERYQLVKRMTGELSCQVKDLMQQEALRQKIKLDHYVDDEVGLPTLTDIMAELAKPGRDPRDEFEIYQFSDEVHSINDLVPGMKLPGIVTNITKFGAFVDIGVHQDGLVHISQMADRYISDPAEVVRLRQNIDVTVMDVDIPRKRISLSML